MAALESLQRDAAVRGILPDRIVHVVDAKWHGSTVVEIVYKDSNGKLGTRLLYRDDEPSLEILTAGKPWSFDADAEMLRLVSEANRIRLAYLFDPLLAIHSSLIDPLPHQITAVYGQMLQRQPLRYLLADDPGAGKTIMAGLLVKELLVRGDVQRCLIVSPGNLVDQWQDELGKRFQLPFEQATNEGLESARTGNWFAENPLAIARLDKLSRNEDVQSKLRAVDWDLIICDEAHKMSATYFGGEVNYTKRYRLGQLLSASCRNFLLLTATPHNGKEEDFQLFMALLDGDRFEGKFRDGVHVADNSDLMRRMVKEQLVTFENKPLFPERFAYTVEYELSDLEAKLYADVTDYVREQFNRADRLESDGRKNTVGFALTTLQRRLASSPEAIYRSLQRRRERLERRIREEELLQRGEQVRLDEPSRIPILTLDDLADLDDAPDAELEEAEEQFVDEASTAQTIRELHAEIDILKDLEDLAFRVRRSGTDRKWDELSRLLQDNSEMFDPAGRRRKLVIFTEHRDTLNYLNECIGRSLGRPESIVMIHGGLLREERRKAQEAFTQDPDVQILLATDAAGEGINLQRAHLMVNYDLPWNPNRLEQRFGRIHRIGQHEVCHLWNLVAANTREGEVFLLLLKKLEKEREALGGSVFDVLGRAFQGNELRSLMIEAIRYGERPEVKAKRDQVIGEKLDVSHLRGLMEERALGHPSLSAATIQQIREDMERAEARRLQPHFIAAFFLQAFRYLGGTIHEREAKRFEITHVPAAIRNRDRMIGIGDAVLPRYERITFEKQLISLPGKPLAAFVCPGHSLLDATIDLILERFRDLPRQGAVLIDPLDPSEQARVLMYLEHSIQDARQHQNQQRVISRRMQFVELMPDGKARAAGFAPYLDYRAPTEGEHALLKPTVDSLAQDHDFEDHAKSFAIEQIVPEHLQEVRQRREYLIDKTIAAVHARLTKEISYWDHRAEQLRLQEQAGKTPRLNSAKAAARRDELEARQQKRMAELKQERQISAAPPVVTGGALVIPAGLLAKLGAAPADSDPAMFSRDNKRAQKIAMDAVMASERARGHEPIDVEHLKCGYDIESRVPARDGEPATLRFIEVKGRAAGADTVTVTRNEVHACLNSEEFYLAIVEIDGDTPRTPKYVHRPFQRELEWHITSINCNLPELLARARDPS